MKKNDNYWMQKALGLAKQAALLGEVPIGAVVVFENQIIGKGYNCPISSNDPTAHAEIIALRRAAESIKNYRLPDVTLYVTLEPCLMCFGGMVHARISRLVFGAYDKKVGVISNLSEFIDGVGFNHKIEFCGGFMSIECERILTNFFVNKRQRV